MSTSFKPVVLILVAGLALGSPASGAGQSSPPVSGVNGTLALEGTMKTVYRGANKVIVATIDGVEHVYTFTKDLIVHGGKEAPVDAHEGLQKGTTVVHYNADGTQPTAGEIDVIGPDGLSVTEGVVTTLDRGHQKITVTYDNGKTEVFQLTQRAAAEAPRNDDLASTPASKVLIYYTNEKGQKVVHFVKKVS